MLGQGHDGGHALLVQVGEQLMHLHGQKLFSRHRIHEPVHAVDHDDLNPRFHQLAHGMHELAGRDFGGIDLAHQDLVPLDVFSYGNAQPIGPVQ